MPVINTIILSTTHVSGRQWMVLNTLDVVSYCFPNNHYFVCV